MVMSGYPALHAELNTRIRTCVPSNYSTDTFVPYSNDPQVGPEKTEPILFRNFTIHFDDHYPGDFAGNYAYNNKNVSVVVSIYYTEAGANRVLGTDDVDFRAFCMQDVDDLEEVLIPIILLEDGTTARMIRTNAVVNNDETTVQVDINYNMPVFIRSTQKVPKLYIGPDQKHTLDGGTKFYLVAQSDLAVDATIASSPAGLTHVSSLVLGSGVPSVVEFTAAAAGTYTFTLASSSGTTSCTVVVYPSSDYTFVGPNQAVPNDQWTLNIAVASSTNGTVAVTGSANITVPATVAIVNNKGVIPVTIVTRGTHTVTVGSNTCTFTSATPVTTVPYFNPWNFFDVYGTKGNYSYYTPLSGCIDPRVENYACMNVLGDNTRRFTLAVKLKTSQVNTSTGIIGVGATNSYYNAHMMLHTYGPTNLSFYWYNVSGVIQAPSTNTALVNDNNWYSYVFNVFYDRNTMTGYVESWRNGVYTAKTNLVSTSEPGYGAATWFHKFLIQPAGQKMSMRDIYVSNTTLWTQTEASAHHAGTTIDPSKYTLHWTCQKNTGLPYHIEYDTKNNMPMTFDPSCGVLTWVPLV